MEPARGFLTGKYRREQTGGAGRLSGANPFGDSKFTDANWAVLDVLNDVAKEQERSPAEIALAWVMGRPGVATTLIGATSVEQLRRNIAAGEVALGDDQRARLDEVGRPDPGFSGGLTAAPIRRMVFGGQEVRGWDER